MGMERHQVGPQASRFLPQRLTLGARGGVQATQHDEADDALGGRLLVGHALFSLQHRVLARTGVRQWAGGDSSPDCSRGLSRLPPVIESVRIGGAS